MTTGSTTGLGTLLRLDLRLERWRLAAWVFAIASMPFVVFRSYASLFSSSAQREGIAKAFGSSASLTVIAGPANDLSSVGGLTTWKCLVFCATLAAVLAISTVIRRTRGDEEVGRTELLGSTPLVPQVALSAGLLLPLAALVAMAAATTGGLLLAGSPLIGALGLSGAIAGTGVAFVGIAAVAAQITTTSRAASALALLTLGLAFALRAIGDTTSLHWLDWVSPLGWAEEVAPYSVDRLWVLGLFLLLGAILWRTATMLLARRDLGGGLLAERAGPATGGHRLATAGALARRLDARWLLAWTVGLVVFGAVIGSVTESMSSLAADNPIFARLLGRAHGTLSDLYLAQMLEMLSVLAAAAGVQAVLRARSEEESGRAEELLATGLTRVRFLGSHLAVGMMGGVTALLVGGMSLGAAAALSGAEVSANGLLSGILVQAVPCLVLIAAAAALIGCTPRLSVLALPVVAATYVLTTFGDLLRLPAWALALSVYTHAPRVPGGTADFGALLILGACAIILVLSALFGIRRRDLT